MGKERPYDLPYHALLFHRSPLGVDLGVTLPLYSDAEQYPPHKATREHTFPAHSSLTIQSETESGKMKFNLNIAVLSSASLIPLLASAKGYIDIRAMQIHGDSHKLEIFAVDNGSKGSSRLQFQWIDKEGFKLVGTAPIVANPGWGAGIGAFTYVNNNGDKIEVSRSVEGRVMCFAIMRAEESSAIWKEGSTMSIRTRISRGTSRTLGIPPLGLAWGSSTASS